MADWIVVGVGITLGVTAFLLMLAAARDAGPRRSERDEWPRLWPALVCLGLLATLAIVWNVPAGRRAIISSRVNALAISFVLSVVGTMAAYAVYRLVTIWDRRKAIEPIVIGQVAAVTRQQLPMATAVSLAADSERGTERAILHRISVLLAQGLPLSEAVRLGYPNCSGLTLSLIAAGEKAGQLPAALDQAEQVLAERNRWSEPMDGSLIPYLCVLILTTGFIVSGIMVAVVPKFKEIFKDFGTQLPGITVALIDVSDWFVSGTPPGWFILAPLLILAPVILYLSLRPRRADAPLLASRLADWFRWNTPGLRVMERGQSTARVLQTIRIGLRSGMTLDQAAWLAADIDVNTQLRPRVRRFAELLRQGTRPGRAAEQAELGGIVSLALAAGQRSHNLDAALRYAIDYNESLSSRAWLLLRNLAWPIMTLTMATVVGFVVVSLFTPLVALINSCMV